MREVLFRGQTRRKGEKVRMDGTPVESNWVYGGIFQGPNRSVIYGYDPIEKHVVYSETVGQFTGLTDKNGKKIFEGDIVVIRYEQSDGQIEQEVREVHYDTKECCWYPMRWEEHCDFCDNWTEILSLEVIGNIHDNPELLEVD